MVAIFIWRKSAMIWSLKTCLYNVNIKGHLPWSFTEGMALWDKSIPISILLWLKKPVLSSQKTKIFVTIGKSYSFKCFSFLSYPFPSVLSVKSYDVGMKRFNLKGKVFFVRKQNVSLTAVIITWSLPLKWCKKRKSWIKLLLNLPSFVLLSNESK